MGNTGQAARYREISRLGSGGMATVTLAEDVVLGRPVALKRVHVADDRRAILRLKREALVGASLNHPNLVSIYDAQVEDDGDVTIVMEYVRGTTVADAIRSRGALPPSEALRVMRGVAAALDVIHARGIVHRDVKPANVLLGEDGAVKLADLGVADAADRTRITSADAIVGSLSYMAPEQLEHKPPNPRMDVYALAAVAYELLSGQKARPESNPLALAHAIATQPPPDLSKAWPGAPAEAAAVLRQGMSADPAQRPATAGELVNRLAQALGPKRATAVIDPPSRRLGRAAGAIAPAVATTAPRAARRSGAARPRPPAARAAATSAGARRAGVGRGQPSADRGAVAGRTPRAVPAVLLAAALITVGVVVALVTAGGTPRHGTRAATSVAGRHRHAAAPTSRASDTTAGGLGASPQTTPPSDTHRASPQTTPPSSAAKSSAAAAPESGSPAASRSTAAAPSAAVEQFYEAAAQHRYSTAWALADQNMRGQLGGYTAFTNQMSSVRSISFHRAQVVGQPSPDTATVAVQTTSVQTSRTQQCGGTVRTVRAGGAWLLDGIAISCS